MPPNSSLVDKRLLGTWKSDRRRTFQNYRFSRTAKPAAIRKLKAIFGRLTVSWTRTATRSWFEGDRPSSPEKYEVIGSDASSVVVRVRSIFPGEEAELRYIVFEGDGYWITGGLMGSRGEFFRKIADTDSPTKRSSRHRN